MNIEREGKECVVCKRKDQCVVKKANILPFLFKRDWLRWNERCERCSGCTQKDSFSPFLFQASLYLLLYYFADVQTKWARSKNGNGEAI